MLKRSYLKTLNDKRLRDLFDQYSDALDSLKKESLLKVDNKRLKSLIKEYSYAINDLQGEALTRLIQRDYKLCKELGWEFVPSKIYLE